MSGYFEGTDRGQMTLFPDRLEDWIGEDNPVRVVDLFVDEIDLADPPIAAKAARAFLLVRFVAAAARADSSHKS